MAAKASTVQVRIEPEHVEALKETAARNGVTVSELVRTSIHADRLDAAARAAVNAERSRITAGLDGHRLNLTERASKIRERIAEFDRQLLTLDGRPAEIETGIQKLLDRHAAVGGVINRRSDEIFDKVNRLSAELQFWPAVRKRIEDRRAELERDLADIVEKIAALAAEKEVLANE